MACSLKSGFSVETVVEPFYSGGQVACVDPGGEGPAFLCPHGDHVKLIDLNSGQIRCQLKDADNVDSEVTCLCATADSAFAVVAYRNLLLKLWNLKTLTCERSWKSLHRAPVISMDADCQAVGDDVTLWLATGSADASVRLWDLSHQSCVASLRKAESTVSFVKFLSHSSNHFAWASSAGVIRVWQTVKSQLVATLRSHSSAVTSLLESSTRLFSSGRDSIISIWNKQQWTLERTVPCFEPLQCMLFLNSSLKFDDADTSKLGSSPDYVITGSVKGSLKVWDLKRCISIDSVPSSEFGDVALSQILCCHSTQQYCVISEHHVFYLLDASTLKLRRQLVGFNDEVLSAAFLDADTQRYMLVATNAPELRVYDRRTLGCQLLRGHSDTILSVCVLQHDKTNSGDVDDTSKFDAVNVLFATASKDNTVRLWSARLLGNQNCALSIQCVCIATGHTASVNAVRFGRSRLPSFLASISEDCTLKTWSLSNFAADNKSSTADDDKVARQILQGVSTVRAHQKQPTCIDVSPNNKLLATGSMDKTIKIWHVSSKYSLKLANTISGHKRGVWDVCFSPIDQVVASASGDGTVKIFALFDGSCVKSFQGHEVAVLKVLFCPSGLQLLSTDTVGLLKLWTIKSGECVKTIDAHDGKCWALAANDECSLLITGSSDSLLKVWHDVTVEETAERLRAEDLKLTQEQSLVNLIHRKKYEKALSMAIALNRPQNAYHILQEIILGDDSTTMNGANKQPVDNTTIYDLEKLIKSLEKDQLHHLLQFVVEWNTNSRFCLVAQTVLNMILKLTSIDELVKIPGFQNCLESLLPYSERHFDRLTKLKQQAAFLNFTWFSMRQSLGLQLDDQD